MFKRKMKMVCFVFVLGLVATNKNQGFALDEDSSIRGTMVGAEISELMGFSGVALGVKHWDQHWGVFGSFGFDTNDYDIIEQWGYSLDAGPMVGFEYHKMKPFLRLGFGYSQSKDKVSDIETKGFSITPTFGVEFLASESFVFGVNLLSIPFVVDGKIEVGAAEADFDGYSVAFLNGISLAYRF